MSSRTDKISLPHRQELTILREMACGAFERVGQMRRSGVCCQAVCEASSKRISLIINLNSVGQMSLQDAAWAIMRAEYDALVSDALAEFDPLSGQQDGQQGGQQDADDDIPF
ncbi:hypothetical protein ABZT49_16025 [Methylobacterium sp. EM32]|uniref:hypothetical protein n=1 Tax=Methylobacterium sp. EM32 TaxID=3163481 RepID=UPI0033AD16B2